MTERKMMEKKKLAIASPDHALGRVDTAQLTASGIRFKWMNFHDPNVTPALLDDLLKDAAVRSQNDKPYALERVQVVIKWNPADAGAILVWNRGGQPRPHFVTMRNRDPEFGGVSFWHWEKTREFAKHHDLDFKSEADRWEARDRLRKHWERLASNLQQTDSLRFAGRVLPSGRLTD